SASRRRARTSLGTAAASVGNSRLIRGIRASPQLFQPDADVVLVLASQAALDQLAVELDRPLAPQVGRLRAGEAPDRVGGAAERQERERRLDQLSLTSGPNTYRPYNGYAAW